MKTAVYKKKNGNSYELIISLVLSLILFACAYVFSSGPFYTNDEVLMRSIVNGEYNGNISGHAIYLMAPLSYLMAVFYMCIPVFPWYDIFITLIHFSSIWMIIFGLGVLSKVNRMIKSCLMILYTVVIAGFYLSHILYSQFTLIAALPFCAGLVLLMCLHSEGSKIYGYISILFLMCSAFLRKQVFLMGCPLLCALYVILFIKGRGRKAIIKNFVALLGVTLIVFLTDYFCYASSEWQNYLEYNDNFSLSEDYYGFPGYDNAKETYDKYGISEVERNILASLNISLIDDYTFEAAGAIAEDGAQLKKVEIEANGIGTYIWMMKYEFVNTFKTKPIGMTVILSAVLLGIISVLKLDVCGLLIPIGCVAYQLVFSFYFLVKNRFPERISLGLYMIELCMILSYVLWSLFDNEKGWFYRKVFGNNLLRCEKYLGYLQFSIACAAAILLLIIGSLGIKYESGRVRTNQEEWDKYIEEESVLSNYCSLNSGNIYLVNGDVANWTCDRMFINGYKDSPNIIPLSYWTEKSPVFIKKKALNNLESLSEALVVRDDVYLVQRESSGHDWIAEFYRDQGMEVSITVMDTIKGAQGINEILCVEAVDYN